MVLDSLRFWNQEMHIDGFRFDLASIFSRNADGSLNWGHAPIFSEIAADPELSRLYLIAEPWDAGAYQLGRGFPGITWRQAQWANGHNNQDGTDDNYSWNCGHEGEEGAPSAVLGLRRKQVKNFCCLLMLSNGTPMFRAGDEFLNTQFGNNNPYNQDNETGWLDWSQLRANEDIFRFFKCMIAFRKNHPSLGRSRFWREDISWYGTGSTVDLSNDSHSLAFCLHGASQDDDDVYVMINGYWEDLEFHVQEGTAEEWKRIVDTALPGPNDFLGDLPDQGVTLERTSYLVAPRSIVMLLRTRRR
jgi:glycogen operon protein